MQKHPEPKPTRRPRSIIRTDIETACLGSDDVQLESLLLEGSRNGVNRGEFLLPLARLYEELSRPDKALVTWRDVFAEEPSLEAAYQILRHSGAADGPTIRDKIEPLFSPAALKVVDDLLRHGPTPPRTMFRHLAICGTSYSGSTMLGRFLDSLDGFQDIGESHWLIDQKELTDGKRQIDFFTRPPSPTRRYCRQCGEECRVLSTDFRVKLQLHRCQWYARIAERLDTSILVSSDKNSSKYLALDPKLRFDAVVLFKPPVAAWHSFYKRLRVTDPDEARVRLERFMADWSLEYEKTLRMMPSGQKLFLQFDTLVRAPKQAVERLLEVVGLPKRELDLDAAMKGRHAIGGNDDFIATSRKTERIDVKPLIDQALPEEHLRMIAGNDRMVALFDELSSRSRSTFGSP